MQHTHTTKTQFLKNRWFYRSNLATLIMLVINKALEGTPIPSLILALRI
jgi:hypothetical protein